MHTIVIHFGKKYEDWHLIEPFFYHAQRNNELTFFWEETSGAPSHVGTMVEAIIEHLERHRIHLWQLVCLINNSDERMQKIRMASLLHELDQHCFVPLEKRGCKPQQIVLHLLDTISRNADFSPTDTLVNMYWELDNYGLIRTEKNATGNSFTLAEIQQLNEAWGTEVNLHHAGVLDQPNEDFLRTLDAKCQDVITALDRLTARKKKQLNQKEGWAVDDNWITSDHLKRVQEDFNDSITQLKTLPLTPTLIGFKPSSLLADIIKDHISIYSEIGKVRLIRQEIFFHSNNHRLKGYIELAYFLLTILDHPKIIDRITKGSTSSIHIQINDELLEKLLTNYYFTLVQEKQLIENQLLLGTHFHTNRLKREDLPPHLVPSVEKIDMDIFSEGKINISHSFFDKWEGVLYRIESKLEARQKELVQSTKEAVQKFMVLKRNNHFITEEEVVEINDYLDELKKEIGKEQLEVIKEAPSLIEAVEQWQKAIKDKKNMMQSLLKCIPNDQQLSFILILAAAGMLLPFFLTLNWRAFSTYEVIYHYLLIPLIVLLWIGVAIFFTRKKAKKPVFELYHDSIQLAAEKLHLQEESQQKYNEYLHHLYQLFTLRKQYQKVYEEGESQKSRNLLLRYHQLKLQEFVQNSRRLLHLLQMNLTQPNEKLVQSTSRMKLEEDCLTNPIYSPFEYRRIRVQDGGHRIDIFVGSTREHYIPGYMNDSEKIRISEDKVYKV